MAKKEKKHTITQEDFLKINRKARRDIEIELQLPKVHSKIHETSKIDQQRKKSNTVKPEDYEN